MTKIHIIILRPENRGAVIMQMIILPVLFKFKMNIFETKQQIFQRFSYFQELIMIHGDSYDCYPGPISCSVAQWAAFLIHQTWLFPKK